MQPQPLTTPFTPDEAQAARIIDAMTDPDISLRTIAINNNTTLESLTLFLARPDIQERLHNLESAIAHRTRLLAANSLPGAITVLRNMLQAYMWEENKITVHPSDKKAVQQRRIAGESTRRAAALLYRLARSGYPDAPRRASRPSTPKTQGQQTLGPTATRAGIPPAPSLAELLARIQQLDPTLLVPTKTQGQQTLGPPVTHAGIPPAPSLAELLARIQQLDPTLLPPPDEPEARARRTTGDSQEAPMPSTESTSPPQTRPPTPNTPSLSPPPPTPTSSSSLGRFVTPSLPSDDQLIHQACLAGAQLLRALGDTSPRASYNDPAPDAAPSTTGPAP